MKIILKTDINSTCMFIGEKEHTKFLDAGDFNFETALKKFCITAYPIKEDDSSKTFLPVSGIFTADDNSLTCNSSHFKIDKTSGEFEILIHYPFVLKEQIKTLKEEPLQKTIYQPQPDKLLKPISKNIYSFIDNDTYDVEFNEEQKQISLTKNKTSMLIIDNFIDFEIDEKNKEIKILTNTEKTTTDLKGFVVVYSLKTGSKTDEFFVSI